MKKAVVTKSIITIDLVYARVRTVSTHPLVVNKHHVTDFRALTLRWALKIDIQR